MMNEKKFSGVQVPSSRFVGFLMAITIFVSGCSTLQNEMRSGWIISEIAPGVKLSHKYFTSLFHAPENINMIDIDLQDTMVALSIAYNDSLLETVIDFGKSGHAIAAVNGNFFNTHIGGSVCFLKVNGHVINRTHDELDGTLYLPWLDTAAMGFHGSQVSIITRPAAGWLPDDSLFSTIISGGPLLLWHKKFVPQRSHRFNNNRYSRTGVGITKHRHLLIITVDGNAEESAGVSTREFAKVFKALKCNSALNFDGGGSTTMWVKGEPDNGVVSHPTDNKRYDHYGERKVANAILILRK